MSLIKNNNGITLRLEKDSSLSFNEMDQNFSSFFYSASSVIDGDLNKLRLYYTGSNELDSGYEANRYMEVLLPRTPESAPSETVSVPGDPTQIIFHGTGTSTNQFATNTEFVFKNNRLGVGLSNPSAPLHLKSTTSSTIGEIRLEPKSSGKTENTKAFYSINIGNTPFLRLGKTSPGNDEANKNIHLFTSKPLEIGYSNFLGGSNSIISRKIRVTNQGVAIGNGIQNNADTPLTVVGEFSIGNTINSNSLHRIGSSNIHQNKLPSGGNTGQGLLIQSPKGNDGGNVVIGVNAGTNNKQSFSIVRGCGGDFLTNDTANCTIATFKVDGNVGIGQVNPKAKLHVQGNISGSGNIKTDGCATFNTIPELERTESFDDAPGQLTKTLVQGSGGLVQYLDAAPIPKGGIIMWGGLTSNIPKGWVLCDGKSKNGIETPDLTDKFVIGASTSYQNTAVTTVKGTTVSCISSKGGTTTISRSKTCKLTEAHIPAHNHRKSNGDSYGRCSKFLTSWQVGSPVDSSPYCNYDAFSGMNNSAGKQFGSMSGITTGGGTDSSIGDSKCPEMIIRTSYKCLACAEIQTYGKSGNNQSSIDLGFTISDHLPPYYALAFIMYVGE